MPRNFMGLSLDLELRKGLKIENSICLHRLQGQENREVGIGFGEVEVGDSKGHFWARSEEKSRGSNSEIIYDYFIFLDFTIQVIYKWLLYRIISISGLKINLQELGLSGGLTWSFHYFPCEFRWFWKLSCFYMFESRILEKSKDYEIKKSWTSTLTHSCNPSKCSFFIKCDSLVYFLLGPLFIYNLSKTYKS